MLPVVTAGLADNGDAVIVTERAAQTLSEVPRGHVTTEDLAELWAALASLHATDIAHRGIDRFTVVRRHDGAWAFGDLDDARIAPDPSAFMIDRVRLLVATAVTAVGRDLVGCFYPR